MEVTMVKNGVKVERHGGPRIRKFRPGFYVSDEDSSFFHAVKKELIRMGFDVVKVRASNDKVCGPHLVDDWKMVIRERRGKFLIHWGNYMLHPAVEEYNNKGVVTLDMLGGG